MSQIAARQFLGRSVISEDQGESVLGIVENLIINPKLLTVDGYLIGQAGEGQNQLYLPRECTLSLSEQQIRVCNHAAEKPAQARRIIGLSAWTLHPKFLVGFVYDFHFDNQSGAIQSFVVHQLIRTWTIPSSAVEKITPKALIINNDTTVKLKITPFPAQAL